MISRLYQAITDARNSLYEKGLIKSFSLGAKTISIGNITVGGTGKTPMVALVAEILAENGERVCILTRGYGRENASKRVLVSDSRKILADAKQAGDEPFELAVKLQGKAFIVADANRAAAGRWAREKFGITAFVLDDAFQHLRVRRDLDVVLLDATNPFGNKKILPSGILRESLKNLKRADAIVITRANLAEDVSNLKSQIKKYNADCPIFVTENKVSRLTELKEFTAKTQSRTNGEASFVNYEKNSLPRCYAFCALGNPKSFFEQMRRENFNLADAQKFPDHHFYTPKDIEKILERARKSGAEILLTTAKDAVKLKDLNFDLPCLIVESEIVFEQENEFRRMILNA